MYSGRIPCFLPRNINGAVDKSRRQYNKRKRAKRAQTYSLWQNKKPKTQKATKEFYFRKRRSNTKHSPAQKTVGKSDTKIDEACGKILCLRTLNCKRPASGGIGQHQTKRLCLEFERKAQRNVKSDGSFDAISTEKIYSSDSHVKDIFIDTDQTTVDILNDQNKCYQRTQSFFKKFKANNKKDPQSDSSDSQDICKPFSDPRVEKIKLLRVSLEDCFAQGLHDKQKLCQTTSTPKAMKVKLLPSSHVASSLHTPRPPPSRVLTSDTSPKVPTSYVTPGLPSSHTTQRKVTSKSTPRVPSSHITPPQSDFSSTENESSSFTKKKRTVGEKRILEKSAGNKTYKPLFSNKPRLWKSVVVENDD